ncbi:MAG: class A beta-lactamase-related serine hydrolase [Acidobacteria bacterium]|nr:class A beta-lactamase-related serine hydrolase [Acidobacteriota bacterium]MBI3487545.1 class A beta-lactamase-related serine hydrolase [Acidobacteriota bacterium]
MAAPLAWPGVRSGEAPAPVAKQVEAYLRSEMQERRIPGLQVAVVRHGKIALLGAYGLANLQHQVPVTDHTVFSINSATKSFTGVAMMQLAEEGKVDLDAPVSRYLEGLPAPWQPVTLRQLLIHVSGIPNIVNQRSGKLGTEGGDDAAWAHIQTVPMDFPTGERYSYNQTNYLLLGKVIDKVSGMPFVRFITEGQFQVVGMPGSGFGDSRDVIPLKADPYRYSREGHLSPVYEEFPAFLRTGAGLNTTAKEVAHWIMALQQRKLLKRESSLSALWTPGKFNNGTSAPDALGWPAIRQSPHRAVAGIGGARSAFYVYPDDDLAVVILTNLRGADPEKMIDTVAGFYLPTLREVNGSGFAVYELRTELLKRGFEHAAEVFRLARQKHPAFQPSENDLIAWGYRLLEQHHPEKAIPIFKLGTDLYPRSSNAYDSLAEAYEAAADRASALSNYRRSLELDSKNDHAVARIKALQSATGGPQSK